MRSEISTGAPYTSQLATTKWPAPATDITLLIALTMSQVRNGEALTTPQGVLRTMLVHDGSVC